MSLIRRNRDRILAAQSATVPVTGGGFAAPAPRVATDPVERAGAEMRLRLTHDLRRLKQIKSREAKIAAKREMLPEYRAWCDGLLEAGAMTVGNSLSGQPDDVLPVIMIWSIDTGDWPRALELAAHVLRFDMPLPARYMRDAATLIVEQVADEAIALQANGKVFPLAVLEQVEDLTTHADIFDEVRAKLMKAIGTELARDADTTQADAPAIIAMAERALVPLRRAQELHDRAGVKDRIKRLERTITAASKPLPTTIAAGSPGD